MSRFEKLIIALCCAIIASVIIAELANAEVDGNSALHFGGSAWLGVMTGIGSQNIDDTTIRRTTAIGVCMVPGVVKEATDPVWSAADLGFDLAGCVTGLVIFEGINLWLTEDSINVVGRW